MAATRGAALTPRAHTAPARGLGFLALGLALLCALSIAFLDVRIARAVAALPAGVHASFRTGTGWLDVLSGKKLADSALALALLAGALALWTRPARRALAEVLALAALSNSSAHLLVGVLKNVFGRLRPFQIAEASWVDRFFAGGGSFPSGHTAFYLGVCLPLAWALPRWRLALLAPALFIAAARVLVNDHFAGDVLGAAAVTVAVCALWIAAFRRMGRLAGLGCE